MKHISKKLLSLMLVLAMVLAVSVAASAESTAVEAADYDALMAALAEGKDVVLTADISIPSLTTIPEGVTVDLGKRP